MPNKKETEGCTLWRHSWIKFKLACDRDPWYIR